MLPEGAPPADDLAPTISPVVRPVRLGLWGRLRFILEGSATHIVEFGNALLLFAWGLWLILPLHSFALNPVLYHEMARLAPEWEWGLAAVAIGLTSLFVLLVDGRDNRARLSLVQFVYWLFVAVFVGQGIGFRAPEIPVYTLLSLGAGWVYIRLERDRRRPG